MGDIETIKFLLSNQQASIYDRTPRGTTAFHFAIGHRQLEVCKLLRHAGIFAQFDDNDYRHSLRGLEQSLNDFTEHNLSLLRVVAPLNDPDRDWFREYCQTMIDDITTVIHADIELFYLLNSAQSDTAMLDLSHLKAYFEHRNTNPYFEYHSFMPYIVRVLSNISTVYEITAARNKYAWIVYALAGEIAHTHIGKHRQVDANTWLHSVRLALRAVAHAGLDPHQTSGKLESPFVGDEWYQNLTMTPLGLLCVEATKVRVESGYGTQSEWNQDMNAKLQVWLTGLHSAGIDLLQYAESEFVCYGRAPDSLAIPWKTDASIMVVTGPRPEDWHLSLWEPCESHARLFWCLVEGTPVLPRLIARILEAYPVPEYQNLASPDLPGSWPSEEARIAEDLESWLLRRTDDVLAQIEEDLSLLSESDFFVKWYRINDILPRAETVKTTIEFRRTFEVNDDFFD
jgi:hypothetical protein